MIFYYLFLFSFGVENGFWSAVLLFSFVSMTGLLASMIFGSIFGAADFMEELFYDRMMTMICSMDPVCQTSKTSSI